MFKGEVIIVTGGATGIGRGISGVLAREGARVAIVQPDKAQAQTAAETIPGAHGFGADISDSAQVESMVDQVCSTFGQVDGLVNNAALTGLPAVASFVSASNEHVSKVIDVNLKGAIWCSQAVVRRMLSAKTAGSIVHIASVGAFAAQELATVYCVTKAGLVALARSMALELGPYQIRVNCVAPGDILTEASADVTTELKALGATGQYWRRTPLGRRGDPSDIGEAVAFLLSERARFITGSTLLVDGGFLTY